MTGLARKELRQLFPIAALVAVFMVTNLVFAPLTGRLDELTWQGVSDALDSDSATTQGLILLLLALVTAYSLFPREYEERTIEFLHSLPIPRWRIFVAKVGAGAAVLLGGIFLGIGVDALLTIFNSQSFGGSQFRLDTALRLGVILSSYAVVVLCHGVFLSFFRRFGLLLYGVAWWVILTLEQGRRPVPWVNPVAILRHDYFGTVLQIPWALIAGHLLASLVILGASFALWTLPADGALSWYQRLRRKKVGKAMLGLATVAIVGLSLFTIDRLSEDDDSEREGKVVFYQPFAPARYSSRHFTRIAH